MANMARVQGTTLAQACGQRPQTQRQGGQQRPPTAAHGFGSCRRPPRALHSGRSAGGGRQQRAPRRAAAAASASDVLAQVPILVAAALADPSPGLLVGAGANTLVYLLGIRVLLAGLTWEGVLSSWVLGTLSFAAFGAGGYALVCLYFIVGSLVTKVKLEQKQREGIAEARSGRRSLGSVLGSGLAGMVCALLALTTGNTSLWRLAFVASFASKLADTTSSEIGKAYGRRTFLATTLRAVPRGTEGAVSLEGTLAGVAAAALMGGAALALGQVDVAGVAVVTAAAFLANLLESHIGAGIQGRVDWLTNDVVNVIQICVAAAVAAGLKTVLLPA